MFDAFLQSPYAIYIIIGVAIILIFLLASTIIQCILRFIFRKIKFSISLLIVFVIMAIFIGKSFANPLSVSAKDAESKQIVTDAVDSFKGIYDKQLPLVAWKFTELDSAAEDENAPTRIKISYFPFGSVIVSYDQTSQQFALTKSLNEGKFSFLDKLLESVDPTILEQLPW